MPQPPTPSPVNTPISGVIKQEPLADDDGDGSLVAGRNEQLRQMVRNLRMAAAQEVKPENRVSPG